MTHRSQATTVAVVLLVAFGLMIFLNPVPYVRSSPGPTIDVLGDLGDEPIVQVEGRRTYPTEGELRLTTVTVDTSATKVSLFSALRGWADPAISVLPFASIYPDSVSVEQDRAESAAQMVSSQDTAVAAALTELGYDLPTYPEVTGITPGGPSEGILKPRDRVLRVNGAEVVDLQGVLGQMDEVSPGEEVTVVVERRTEKKGRQVRSLKVTSGSASDDPERAVLGVLIGTGFEFPFDVRVALGDNIGGPSAGLMFALSIYDVLTPGPLTGDHVVAGTGTITADGQVGPIGGIQQKIVGAQRAGATLFFVPPDNCTAALGAALDTDAMELVRADSLQSALSSLEAYADNPDADLPRCPS